MSKLLPVRLEKEPLIEAVCELRVLSNVALNTYFPGILLAKHPMDVTDLRQLPAMMIPEQVRAAQAEMAFAPLVQLRFKGILVMVGERSLVVANPAPYLGWAAFRALIVEVFTVLLDANLVTMIERYSIKYTNVFKENEVPEPRSALAWKFEIADLDLKVNTTTLRTETIVDGFLTIITMSGGVTAQAEGVAPMQGALIDIDTISQAQPQGPSDFASSMSVALDQVRLANKTVFFKCLTDEAVDALKPIYQ